MRRAGDDMEGVYWIRCFLHVMHCAIGKGMAEVDARTQVLEKCRNVVNFFSKSTLRKKLFMEVQRQM